jgi:GT2 family glycosyltransferase
MPKQPPKITIGILSYYDQQYLEQTLPILTKQDYPNYQIIICDNTQESQTAKWINQNYPQIKTISPKKNLGFSKGHNLLIKEAAQNKSKYYLCFNSDIYPTPNYLTELLKPFQENSKLAAVTPKILTWNNFPLAPTKQNKKDQTLDSTGIEINIFHYFKERGYSKQDLTNQYPKQVWGFSGASPLLSINALQDTQISPDQYFDEDMFMYKEDLDLSYRLRWAGYETNYQPTAISWHNRTAQTTKINQQVQTRKSRPEYIRQHSFLNHLQLIYKNWDSNFSITVKLCTLISISTYFAYLIIFDRKTLQQYKTFKQRIPTLKQKKNNIKKRITAQEMQNNFKLI